MFSQEFTIKNPTGLHARPASKLAALCKGLPDEIRLVTAKGAVNPQKCDWNFDRRSEKRYNGYDRGRGKQRAGVWSENH